MDGKQVVVGNFGLQSSPPLRRLNNCLEFLYFEYHLLVKINHTSLIQTAFQACS